MKTSNRKASEFVTRKREFEGWNTFGKWVSTFVYVVYSYGYHFPMYVLKDGIWYENGDKYSVSTSKQQTQLRPEIDGAFIVTTTEKLQSLIG